MKSLSRLCELSAVDAQIIEKALSREGRDFEDTVQYFSSKTINADIILTRDDKGFAEFDILHMTVEQFLNEFLPDMDK